MAYNRRNFLELVIEIQKIVKEEKAHGKTQKWIYYNLINKRFHISRSTFNNYMCINARRELSKLDEKELLNQS